MHRPALVLAQLSGGLLAALAIAAPAQAATTLSHDTYSRQLSGSWGSADVGGSWSLAQGPASSLSVGSGTGVVNTPAGFANQRLVHMPSKSMRDVDITTKLSFSAIKGTGAYGYSSIVLRRQANGAYTRVGLWAFSTGKLLIHSQASNGATVAPDANTGMTFTAGTSYNLRVQAQGATPTTIRAKAWKVGTAEPAAWQTQSRTLQGPQVGGTVGVRTNAIKTPGPVAFKVDDLRVADFPIPKADPAQWKLVASDEFNGTAVDTTKWSPYNGKGHGGNGLRRPAQLKVENGNLVITAQMINGVLHSGGMSHRFSQTYGRFAFRVRTDKDPSQATSGVVLTWPTAGGWPATGENDIYETGTTGSRNPFHSFVHYGATNEQESVLHYADGSQWHEMAMEWDAKTIKIYRDGELVWTLSNAAAIPDVAHHMALQLDAAKANMGGPVKMYVDYVRVYKRA